MNNVGKMLNTDEHFPGNILKNTTPGGRERCLRVVMLIGVAR